MSTTYRVEAVTFPSKGATLAGRLYIPQSVTYPLPAIVFLGPVCFVKEQSPEQYATRLAKEGFLALAFDCRYHGESEGEPRRFESYQAKREDLAAAISFLSSRREADPTQIFGIGICQGVNHFMQVAAEDARLRAIATISGQYLEHANKVGFLGGEAVLEQRIAQAKDAQKIFTQTGTVRYNEIVDATRKDVLLPHKEIWQWYYGWIEKGYGPVSTSTWENRYTLMSEAEIWAYDILPVAQRLHTPLLMIHATMSDGGEETAKKVFANVASQDKTYESLGAVFHTQFYDDPEVIDRAVSLVTNWLQKRERHLAPQYTL